MPRKWLCKKYLMTLTFKQCYGMNSHHIHEHIMHETKTKSKLTNALNIEVSSYAFSPDGTCIDGCAFVWAVPWPKKGAVQNYLDNFWVGLKEYLHSNVIVRLVFDG